MIRNCLDNVTSQTREYYQTSYEESLYSIILGVIYLTILFAKYSNLPTISNTQIKTAKTF